MARLRLWSADFGLGTGAGGGGGSEFRLRLASKSDEKEADIRNARGVRVALGTTTRRRGHAASVLYSRSRYQSSEATILGSSHLCAYVLALSKARLQQ